MAVNRDQLHELINGISPELLEPAYELLRSLAADEWLADNSPLNVEEKRALKSAEQQLSDDETVSWEDLKREFEL
ncbi:hypothetical protein IDH44_13700 [Paenibacillus sp. IB182496]|uniref:Addiction module component n=1 Tax=Paenibacillus sabuli TaxID=2772509 RepID=A0A927GSP9_9BACL|nr:hypothetical protein [Paenibacillus sabuli]MBD2846255.1 hypothetical protein [Paenibacillus sabuli]